MKSAKILELELEKAKKAHNKILAKTIKHQDAHNDLLDKLSMAESNLIAIKYKLNKAIVKENTAKS